MAWPTTDTLKTWLRIEQVDNTDLASLEVAVNAAVDAAKQLLDTTWHANPDDEIVHATLDYAASLWRQRTASTSVDDVDGPAPWAVLRARIGARRGIDFA